MTDLSVAEASVATLLVLCSVGGLVAAAVAIIETIAEASERRPRKGGNIMLV